MTRAEDSAARPTRRTPSAAARRAGAQPSAARPSGPRSAGERATELDRDDEGTVYIRDPRGITALAHPARMLAIDYLYSGREMTATELAGVADVTPSAMSYHLRALARWGVIVRSGETGDGRERRWKAAGTGLQIRGREESVASPATRAAQATLVGTMLDQLRDSLLRRLDRPEPREMTQFSTEILLMNAEEYRQLLALFSKEADRYRASRADPPEDAIAMHWTIVAVPVD